MKSVGTNTITTPRLQLRRFTQADWQDMQKYWVSDPNVQHMYAEPVYETQEEIKQLLEKYIKSYESQDVYRWAVVEKLTGICMGQIAFFLVDCKNHLGEIEYCIGRRFQNKGYITEALRAVIDYGFSAVEMHKIAISHRADNLPSKRVIEKCGFEFEGNFRQAFYVDGTYIDRVFYALLKEEQNE